MKLFLRKTVPAGISAGRCVGLDGKKKNHNQRLATGPMQGKPKGKLRGNPSGNSREGQKLTRLEG